MARLAAAALLLLFAAAAAAAAAAAPSSTKRGLAAYSGLSEAPLLCGDLALIGPAIRWMYSWGLAPSNTSCVTFAAGAVNFEPMVWGASAVGRPIFNASATHMLGFNEPNSNRQSNLTPQAAAKLWPQVAATARAAGLKLVAPVPSGSDTPWLTQFFAACGCEAEIDAVALHPYVGTGAELKQAINTWAAFGKPLFVSEFNNGNGMKNASAAEHLAYMTEALPILEADARVARYAWMSTRDVKVPGASLFAPGRSTLTPLGQFYFGFSHTAAAAHGEEEAA